MKKKILSLFIVATMLAGVFTGCASDTSGNSESSETSENSASNTDVDKKEPIKVKEEYSLSEYLSSGETIWYLTNRTGKDADIGVIYVMEADGSMYYTKSDYTLGEVEQMEDAEIISEVKKAYEEAYKQNLTELSNWVANKDYTKEMLWITLRNIGQANNDGYVLDRYEDYKGDVSFGFDDPSADAGGYLKEMAEKCYQLNFPSINHGIMLE